MKLLKLVIIFQLCIAQMPFISIGNTYANSQTKECQEGMYFHPTLNRCVLTEQVINTKEDSNACSDLKGDAYRECFEKNVQTNLKDDTKNLEIDDTNKGNFGRYSLPIVASTLSAYYLLRVKKNHPECKTGSMWLLIGGAVAALITEISAQAKYKKRTEELTQQYKDNMLVNESGEFEAETDRATDAQTMAIEFKIAEMEERKAVATKRKNGYLIAALAYTSAVGLAIYEQTQVGSTAFGTCAAASTFNNPKYSPLLETNKLYTSNIRENYLDINQMMAFNPKLEEIFGSYKQHEKISEDEFYEIILRKVSEIVFPKAHAQGREEGDIYEENGMTFIVGKDGKPTRLLDEIKVEDTRLPGLQKKGANLDISKPEVKADAPVAPESNLSDFESSPMIQVTKKIAGPMNDKQESVVDRAIQTPYIRAALAGVLATHAWVLRSQAKENEENAQKMIDGLNEILIDFSSTGGAGLASYCTEEDRRLPSKPNCYCYNKNGTQNTARKGRGVCVLYAADKSFSAGKYEHLSGIGYNPMKSCLTSEGKVDDNCSLCKRSPKICNLIPAKTISALMMGSTKLFGKALKSLNDFNDGSLNASNFDESGIQNQMKAFKNVNKKLASDPKNKEFMDKVNKLRGQINGAYKKVLSNVSPKALASITGSAIGNPSASSNLGASLDKNLSKELKDKMKTNELKFNAGGEDAALASKDGSGDFDFGFGQAQGEGGVEIEDELSDVMDKNFQFNSNDIHKNKGGDIFKILSIRYQRSALIRLFDDKGEFQADKSNGNDINNQ